MSDESVPFSGLSADIYKGVKHAVTEFFDNIHKQEAALTPKSSTDEQQAKGWFIDPNDMLDSYGLGYRTQPNILTYESIRAFAERNSVIGSIIQLRTTQVEAFLDVQSSKYGTGFKVVPIDNPDRVLTKGEHERQHYLEQWLLWCGKDRNVDRDGFKTFIHKLVRDRLTFDQTVFEKVRTRDRGIFSIHALDASTIRIAAPNNPKNSPQTRQQVRDDIKYCQLVDGEIAEVFTSEELAFLVQNARTNIRTYGYGFSEIEMLITTVTAHLWAEQWNRNVFKQGSTAKGILNIPGAKDSVLAQFRREWQNMVSGVENAHKLAVLNAPNAAWLNMSLSNTEMGYQLWLEYLVKIICAFYLVDPAELNFDLRGGVGAAPAFMTNNEAQQKLSKDRGLAPLLRFLRDGLNRHVMSVLDDRFVVKFVGLDAKTEAENIELRTKQSSSILTINEARALEKLPPVKNGDIVANPTYTGYLRDISNQQQQQAMASQQGGDNNNAGGGFGTAAQTETEHAARDVLEKIPNKQPEKKAEDPLVYYREDDWQAAKAYKMPASLRKSFPDGFDSAWGDT